MKKHIFRCFSTSRGQATTEMVLLFPVFVIFLLFIIKITGLLVLNQKMQIASTYAARRFQLQSHTTEHFSRGWDRRYLIKDIQRKVGMRQFLSLRDFKLDVNTDGDWIKITLIASTKPPRINFLCNYDKDVVCERDRYCLRGYSFLCENGAQIKVIKYAGTNERPLPFERPES